LPKPETAPYGTFSHFIALFCTVAGKSSGASPAQPEFCNEIKDLERNLMLIKHKKPFCMKHLAEAVQVKPQQKGRRYRM
jgi:hypothetical protein